MSLPLSIIKYCAEEVERQGAEPLAVYWMATAWEDAISRHEKKENLTLDIIEQWGRLVEPQKNKHGFRTVPVWVGAERCPEPTEVPRLMQRFINHFSHMSVDEAYIEFLKVHPFRDGNGRVAKVIYFFLCGELNNPRIDIIPNPWGILNP